MAMVHKSAIRALSSNIPQDIRKDVFYDISQLKDNWNQSGAESIPEKLIAKAQNIYYGLEDLPKPDVFPTANKSIQFEWGDILEMEIFENKIKYLIDINGNEKTGTIEVSLIKVLTILKISNIQ